MESRFKHMAVMQLLCKDELELLQNNISSFLKHCENEYILLRKVPDCDELYYAFDNHMTELSNVLNMARKFNTYMHLNDSIGDGCNGSDAGVRMCYKNLLLQDVLRCGHNRPIILNNQIDHVNAMEIFDDRFTMNNNPSAAKCRLKAIQSYDNNNIIDATINLKTTMGGLNENIRKSILNRELPKKHLDHFVKNYEFDVYITHVQDYINFEFYVCDMDDYPKLYQFYKTSNMQTIKNNHIPKHSVFCITRKTKILNGEVEKKGLVWRAVANYQNIENVEENSIYLIDYGETLTLMNNDLDHYHYTLYKLPQEYQDIPPLAIKCTLKGVLIANGEIKIDKPYLEMTLRKYKNKTVRLQLNYRIGQDLHVILIVPRKELTKSQIDIEFENIKTTCGNPFLSISNSDNMKPCDDNTPTELFDDHDLNNKLTLVDEDVLTIIVTHVNTPMTFYGIKEYHTLFWVDDEIPNIQRLFSSESQPKVDDIVLSQYAKDNYWYRAKILHIDTEKETYKVFYIDYGNIEVVPLSCLAKCTENQLSSPARAEHFRIANLKEKSDHDVQQKQYEQALGAAVVMIENQTVHVKVVEKNGKEFIIHLVDPEYNGLSKILLDMGVAEQINV